MLSRTAARLVFTTALAGVLVAAAPIAAEAGPKFARAFSDHAVLQRDKPIEVWGTALPGASVSIMLGEQNFGVGVADNDGNWRATLTPLATGGPYTLTAADGAEATTLNDIMVGDVLLCGGQSNMEFPERLATGAWGDVAGSANANLRFIIVPKDSQAAPLNDMILPAEWKVSGPDTIGEASAVCYHMAKTLQKSQNVPIGMIDSYWGGTTIQSWISPENLATSDKYAGDLDTLALLAVDPAKAYAEQSKRDEIWWDAHDPANAKNRAFIAANYNDKGWSKLTADRGWKDGTSDLKDFDGVVWLRTTVDLTEAQAKAANNLTLGPIDTFDTTWVNGSWVGASGTSWVWRDYKVPQGVFKAGKNVIVVRVLGGNGFTGQPAFRAIKTSDGQAISLPAQWTYKAGLRATGLTAPRAPWAIPSSLSTLYNGMIAPVAGYGVKLAAWYQGESNADAATEYRSLLPLLMKDWRQTFNDPDLPFFVVQLSSYGSVATQPGKSNWAELREAQRQAVNADPHAGLAVSYDFGDRSDIHPTQKTIIGQRLARAALSVAYGQDASPGGPDAVSATRSGSDIVITFRRTQGGLVTYSSNDAIGFEVCTAPDVCTYTPGTASGDTVVLKGANSPAATSVRFAWADAPFSNLYSKDDQPAVPFQMEISQ